ncbi:efflux RND transporter permease subunit, partial [Vibrio cholerae O1]
DSAFPTSLMSAISSNVTVGIQIVKAADANTVDVVNAVKDKVKDLEKKYKDLEIISTFDQGAPIEKSVETMLSKA